MAQIVYFSIAGETWHGGQIVEQKIGNTQIVAEILGKKLGITPEKIEVQEAYSTSYDEIKERAELEQTNYPALKNSISLTSDVLYLGSPVWFSELAPAVKNWLSQVNLSGVTIRPFVTSEGSGLACMADNLQKLAPNSKVERGLAIRGSRAGKSQQALDNWLLGLKVAEK